MPRTMDPVLREFLERENPRVDYHIIISATDVARVIRRFDDEMSVSPPLVAAPLSSSLAPSVTGGLQLASTSLRLAQQEASANGTDIRPFPRERHLKGLGWRMDPAFDRCVLRGFQARIAAKVIFGSAFVQSRLQLQIYRAQGIPGTLKFEDGTERRHINWTFPPVLQPAALLTKEALAPLYEAPAGGYKSAWVNFDLSHLGVVLSNSNPRGSADVTIEPPTYYFELIAIDLRGTEDDWVRWHLNGSAGAGGPTVAAGVGTFQRTWWDRPSGSDEEEWHETRFLDTNLFRLDIDQYNPAGGFGEAIYLIDLGRAPLGTATGRVVFERALPPGTAAELAISTAGAGGPWTVVSQESIPALAQQTYHLRVRLYPSASLRSTPILHAWGVEYHRPHEVSLETDPKLMPTEVDVPFLKASIGEGRMDVLRTGVRDFRDVATMLASRYSPSSLNLEVWLSSRHPAFLPSQRFLMERSTISMRDPADILESFTTLSYAKKAKREIPQPIETINSVHTVAAGATSTAVPVTAVLPGTSAGGNEYDGQGHYIRVRSSAVVGLETGRTFPISGNTGTLQLDFTGVEELLAVFALGDVIEVHSGRTTQPVLQWKDADLADVWWELFTNHMAIPSERLGRSDLGRARRSGLPPRITDIAPGDVATQDKLRVTNGISEKKEGWALAAYVSFLCGGVTIENAGQILYRQIFPRRDANGVITVAPDPVDPRNVFDPRDYYAPHTPTGLEQRAPIVKCAYGVDYTAADPKSFPDRQTTWSDVDALNWHTQQDLEALGTSEVPEEIAHWCYNTFDGGLFLATSIAQMLAQALSTGMRVWSWTLREARPDLVVGDSVVLVTDRYTDHEPSYQTEIRGWNAYQLVLIGIGDGGRRLTAIMLGLIGNVLSLRGGAGTLTGPYAPIDMPEDFTVVVETQPTPQGGVLQLKSTVTPPATQFLQEFDLQIRTRPVGTLDWGAPGSQRMGRDGLAHTKADYNAEYEVTARAVSSGGNASGLPQTRVVSTGLPPAALPTIGNPIRESTRIRWPLTWDNNGKRMEVWYALSDVDPVSEVSQWKEGTKLGVEYHRDDGRTEIILALPGPTWWVTMSAVFFNAWDDLNASGVVTRKAQGAAPVPPPDIAVLALDAPAYPTATEVRLLATMPGDVSDITGIMLYRDGSVYQGPIARTAGAGAQQAILIGGLNPGATHQWKVKAVDADAIESANFSNTVTATHPGGVLDAPVITLSAYSIPSQGFTIFVTPGANNPPGTLFQGYHSVEGDPFTVIENTTGSSIFHREEQGPVPQVDEVKVKAQRNGWTDSAFSNTLAKIIPKTIGEPP